MKKILTLVLCAMLTAGLAGCANDDGNKINDVTENIVENDVQAESEAEIKTDEKEQQQEETKPEKPSWTEEQMSVPKVDENASYLGFENQKLLTSVAKAIGKTADTITEQDILDIHYLAFGPEEQGCFVYVGFVDCVDAMFSDGSEAQIMEKLNDRVMVSAVSYDAENDTLSDLAKFKNLEVFEIYDVVIEDVSFVKEFDKLSHGWFKNNGITDVSALSDYNPEALVELDLTGNDISDWSPLYHIKDKVIVHFDNASGFVLTLASKLEQDEAKKEQVPEGETEAAEGETSEEVTDELISDEIIFTDENGNPIDWSELFE